MYGFLSPKIWVCNEYLWELNFTLIIIYFLSYKPILTAKNKMYENFQSKNEFKNLKNQ